MKPFEHLRRIAADYEAGVSHSRAEQVAAAAMLRTRPQPFRRTWPAIAAAGAALAFGVVGVGWLADQAAPGQVLYPLDRAYESVGEMMGFNQNRTEERLVEALYLLDRGDPVYAVQLVNEAITDIGRDPDLEEYHASVAELVARPPVATAPPATTTTRAAEAEVSPPVVNDPPAAAPDQPVIVAVAEVDSATTLRLAAEYLLLTVRDAKVAKKSGVSGGPTDALPAAATDVLAAAQVVNDQAAIKAGDIAQDGTTSTTTPATTGPSGSTTTTGPEGGATTTTGPSGTSTTTVPGGASTTTTLPGDGSTTTTVPQGPIVLPIQP